MKAHPKTLARLRQLLREMFVSREQGVGGLRFSRAHGYVDGFMAALVEEKLATQEELLALVLEERSRRAGTDRAIRPRMQIPSCRPVLQMHYLGSDAV